MCPLVIPQRDAWRGGVRHFVGLVRRRGLQWDEHGPLMERGSEGVPEMAEAVVP